MPTCSICVHPQRHQIEAALAAGTSQRQIATQFGVGKSTLGRHTQHCPPLPAAAPPLVPDSPAPHALPPPLTTAQAQATLTQVTQRLAAVRADLDAVLQTLPRAQEARQLARWQEDLVRLHQADAHLTALQQQVEDLRAGVTVLEEARRQAALAYAQAQERRQQQETQHWLTVVLPQLEDAFERYCCRLLAHRSGLPPAPPAAVLQRLGPMGASELRVATGQQLRERFPCVEEEAVHG